MNIKQKGVIIGAIAAGIAIAGALFYLYPNMMIQGTGFQDQMSTYSGPSPQSLVGSNAPTTAGSSSASSGSK